MNQATPAALGAALVPFLPTLEKHHVDMVFTSGSVARGSFYDNWSDIDIVVVAPSLHQELSATISEWRANLHDTFQCKVGMDYINSNRLRRFEEHGTYSSFIAQNLHFIVNFHESNKDDLHVGTLYRRHGYTAPVISGAEIKALDINLDDYYYDLQELVYETLMRHAVGHKDTDTRHALRITIKSIVYFMQITLLARTGELITDYPRLPAACQKLFPGLDTRVVFDVYNLLQCGKFSYGITKDMKYLTQAITCFQALNKAMGTHA